MRYLKYFINLLLIFVVIIFFIENSQQLSQRVQFHFDLFIPGLQWQMPELPIYFLVLAFFVLGGVITTLLFAWSRFCMGCQLTKANRKIKGLEKEIKAYRQLPLIPNELHKDEIKPAPPAQEN